MRVLGWPWHRVARQLMLTRGVIPTVVEGKSPGADAPTAAKECIMESVEYARGLGLCGEVAMGITHTLCHSSQYIMT